MSENCPNTQTSQPTSQPAPLSTNQELAKKIGIENAKKLTWLTRNKSRHYKIHKISKRAAGKYRTIHAPDQLMRVFQFKILTKLLNELEVPDYLWAFEANRSIPQMADMHTNKAVVLSFDIKDFFTSITNNILVDVFGKYDITDKAAITLSEICTYKYFVPQGALTSPKVSNLVAANTFGPAIKEYCENNNLVLSIYADDITISSTEKLEWDQIKTISDFVAGEVRRHNFRINQAKTKVMFSNRRQWVCGAVVNEKVNMLRSERLKLRAMVHNVVKNGYEIESKKLEMTAQKFSEHLRGKLNWFKQLNPERAQPLIDKLGAVACPSQEPF